MKEIQEILRKIEQSAPESSAVIATVVDVRGSSYRLPGARMLIDENGKSIGTVSGGCLEADILERAKKVLQTGEPTVITYDTTKNEDSIFGLGMGCRGVIRVLLESAKNNVLFDFLRECIAKRERGAIATLISKEGDFPFSIGTKMFFTREKKFTANFDVIGNAENQVLKNVSADLQTAFLLNDSSLKSYEMANGAVEFFIETVKLPPSLLVFGAGSDAPPLVELAKNLGWCVSVIDHRAGWANAARFANADEIIVSRAENLNENVLTDENAVSGMMTHNYDRDRETLRLLLNSPVKYIGALGPKKRIESLLRELRGAGENFSQKQLQKLYAPIGLDIGAETPEQIAIAIIAEIQSVLSSREAGFLRDREGGIH